MTSRLLIAAASTALFALAAPASAHLPAGQPAADAPREALQLAHHAPWHTGGRGRHVGWTKQKARPASRTPVLQNKKIKIF